MRGKHILMHLKEAMYQENYLSIPSSTTILSGDLYASSNTYHILSEDIVNN